jgi:23S rRNA pseudouridine955/2504/2580 synthase/23S rRNA pseudouridine1911/1915/1917 synthase
MSTKAKTTEILYQDDDIVIANKPSGVAVIPERFDTGKIDFKQMLERFLGISLMTVHRIDRDTSGVILFAKNADAHKTFNTMFEERQIGKEYLTFVLGKLSGKTGVIDSPIATHPSKNGRMVIHPKGKEAHTEFEVLEQFRHAAFLKVVIKTGRTHQIRVHFSSCDHPLLVDPIYSTQAAFFLSSIKKKYKQSEEAERPILNRLSLHAHSLTFVHPKTGAEIRVESELPKDLATTLNLLRKYDS